MKPRNSVGAVTRVERPRREGEPMSRLSVRLFGRLSVRWEGQELDGLTASKVQELFCYLLLHRERPQSREGLASLLWSDSSTAQAKKYLRQALWQLQVALKCPVEPADDRLVRVDSEWVHLNAAAGIWLDVADFEHAAALSQGVPSENLDARTLGALQTAVDLYQGDLLQGWYQDWCGYERERLQALYLAMLDKLIGFCEVRELFDAGLHYAALSLRYDRARECTHQRLMRMLYLSGDRAAALRQYDRCIIALDEELAVKPSESTVALYDQICAGRLRPAPLLGPAAATRAPVPLTNVLSRLKQIEATLAGLQHQVQQDIEALEHALRPRVSPPDAARRPSLRTVPPPARRHKPAADA